MDKNLILTICGIYNLGFVLFHIAFWKLFKWKTDLRKTSVANKAIIQILNTRLIYVFMIFGIIYLFYQHQLYSSNLGNFLLIAVFGFWLGRTIEQFIFLSVKSKMVNILTVVFIMGVILHMIPLFNLI